MPPVDLANLKLQVRDSRKSPLGHEMTLATRTDEPSASHIQQVITRYAAAYSALQELQEQSSLIPIGDQKTGTIGEFYARLYVEGRYPGAEITFGGHSESGWDLQVRDPKGSVRIQVKTVSAFSSTRRISPILPGWDQLYLVFLNTSFYPAGFWTIESNEIMSAGPLRHCCSPNPATGRGGSTKLGLGGNQIAEFMSFVAPLLESR